MKPRVALAEDIAQNLRLRRGGVSVAVEMRLWIISNFANQFAGLVGAAFDAAPLRVAFDDIALVIEGNNFEGKSMRYPTRYAADRARTGVQIEQDDIALGGGIKFEYVLDREAIAERCENIRPQAHA